MIPWVCSVRAEAHKNFRCSNCCFLFLTLLLLMKLMVAAGHTTRPSPRSRALTRSRDPQTLSGSWGGTAPLIGGGWSDPFGSRSAWHAYKTLKPPQLAALGTQNFDFPLDMNPKLLTPKWRKSQETPQRNFISAASESEGGRTLLTRNTFVNLEFVLAVLAPTFKDNRT